MTEQIIESVDLCALRAGEFPRLLNAWRERWLAGEPIRVLVDEHGTHVIVVEARGGSARLDARGDIARGDIG